MLGVHMAGREVVGQPRAVQQQQVESSCAVATARTAEVASKGRREECLSD